MHYRETPQILQLHGSHHQEFKQVDQSKIDKSNVEFWNELCGSHLARTLSISEPTPDEIRKFDLWYMDYYPYLERYMSDSNLCKSSVLEVGLGYGTLGQRIASTGADYHGIDIAEGPVRMMRDRMRWIGRRDLVQQIRKENFLTNSLVDSSMDYIYAIGCLHHTGNLPHAIAQVHRILRPGGRAIVMVYNAHSFRRLVDAPVRFIRKFGLGGLRADRKEFLRSLYDVNKKGDAAPHTDYTSVLGIWQLFRRFASVRIEIQNFDEYPLLSRSRALRTIARVVGLDIYVVAEK